MRFPLPFIPGATFAAGATAEVAILAATVQTGDVGIPIWVQIIPMGIVLGIGTWGLLRLFAHERETSARIATLERELAHKADAQHDENIRRFEKLEEKLEPVLFAVMGFQGRGGYHEEKERLMGEVSDMRHGLSNWIQYMNDWADRVGEHAQCRFEPPPVELRGRRRGDR